MIEKYIIVKAMWTENELIPIWDKRLVFHDYDEESYITLQGNQRFYDLVDCVYNLETKELSLGTDIDIYPDSIEYKIGDTVYVKKDIRHISKTTIEEINYEILHNEVILGKDIPDIYLERIVIDINLKKLYHIKQYQTIYNLSNGMKNVGEWSLYHISQ